MKNKITYDEKLKIIVHMIMSGYLTENQIRAIVKRGVL